MIARINGTVETVLEDLALVSVGELTYELYVPASDIPLLQTRVGQRMTFFTIEYIEGNASFGQLAPRLIGFLREDDKAFFNSFITVKGIGPRRALRAFQKPVGMIASAISRKDARFLTTLPEIGKRTAEQIIAELHGKVERFASDVPPSAEPLAARPDYAQNALAALVSIGERRAEAETWVDRVCRADPELRDVGEIIKAVYRMKTGVE